MLDVTLTHWGRDKMATIFQMTPWRWLYFDSDLIEICSSGFDWLESSTASDNGLALTRGQAFIWTNDGYFADAYMHHSASTSWFQYKKCLDINKYLGIEEVVIHWYW